MYVAIRNVGATKRGHSSLPGPGGWNIGAGVFCHFCTLGERARPCCRPLPPGDGHCLLDPILSVSSQTQAFIDAGQCLADSSWNTSLLVTTAANATLLNNAAPVWVALFAWLVFHERLSARFWVGLVLTLGGALGVLGSDFLRHPTLGWGDALAILSSLFYAGYFLATQRGRQYLDTLSYIWMVGVISTLVLLLVCLGLGMPLSGYPTYTYLALLGAALISQLGGYLSVGYALGHLPASAVSPTMIGQPVMTAVLALPLLGEELRPAQIIGGSVVLVGILLVHLSRQGRPTVNRVAPGSLDSLKVDELQSDEPTLF
jgi:drug/metabolite transporter (DMT)-like permease